MPRPLLKTLVIQMFATACKQATTPIVLNMRRVPVTAQKVAAKPLTRAKQIFEVKLAWPKETVPKMKLNEAKRQKTALKNRAVESAGSCFQYSAFCRQPAAISTTFLSDQPLRPTTAARELGAPSSPPICNKRRRLGSPAYPIAVYHHKIQCSLGGP